VIQEVANQQDDNRLLDAQIAAADAA